MIPTILDVIDEPGVAAVGRLIAVSFDHLDANRYLIGDPARRLDAMAAYFTILTRHAAAGAGRVLRTSDGAGAAVLFDRIRPTAEPPNYRTRVHDLAGIYADRFTELDAALRARHPTEAHWHLAFLAVHPHRQRAGIGTALISHVHRWLDQNGMAAYLEAANDENAALYRRHQYRELTPSTITIGDPLRSGAVFLRMWRPPQTTSLETPNLRLP